MKSIKKLIDLLLYRTAIKETDLAKSRTGVQLEGSITDLKEEETDLKL